MDISGTRYQNIIHSVHGSWFMVLRTPTTTTHTCGGGKRVKIHHIDADTDEDCTRTHGAPQKSPVSTLLLIKQGETPHYLTHPLI